MSITLIKPVPAVSGMEPEDREKLAESDPRSSVIWINPARVSGTACFAGTRVPLQFLWDHLEEGPSMDDFLDGFPGVSREQATAVLQMALEKLLESLLESTRWRQECYWITTWTGGSCGFCQATRPQRRGRWAGTKPETVTSWQWPKPSSTPC